MLDLFISILSLPLYIILVVGLLMAPILVFMFAGHVGDKYLEWIQERERRHIDRQLAKDADRVTISRKRLEELLNRLEKYENRR